MRSLILQVVVSLAFVGLFVISIQATMEEEVILPICEKKAKSPNLEGPEILLVSTLDGKLTALDPKDNGKTLWSVGTGPGSMLSSTISEVELTSNAKWVRLIPSLAGGLYKFDGEIIEPIPLSAEDLLRTSFRFADNTVMTGGKESRVYGVSAKTGKIRYECTMDGCFKPSGEPLSSKENDLEDIIIVKRETQVVRAVEPRTGSEKWNFSVSTHHLTYQPGIEDICNSTEEDEIIFDEMEDLKAVVPEGIICQVDKNKPDTIKWRQNFNSPIVHAWRLERGQLIPINLFSNSHLPTNEIKSDPSFYIGSYKQQLYIQESEFQIQKKTVYPKVNWKPYLISADSRTTIINHGSEPSQAELPMLTYDPNSAQSTALAVFKQGGNAEYPYDSGLYFYPEEASNLQLDLAEEINNTEVANVVEEIQRPETEAPSEAIQIVFVSMWYWWQEIVLISLLTAAVMNILITRPYMQIMREGFRRRLEHITRRRPQVVVVERRIEVPYEVHVEVPVPKTPETGSTESTMSFARSISNYSSATGDKFVSRYETDYDTVQCLGRGGFGVVFESKNKLDENNYAVKRVRLPSHEEAKKKVMREVKCLAKLDQKNIVRYYSTWLEYPPPGWQEEFDKNLNVKSINSVESCSMLEETTNNPLKPFDCQPRSSTDLNSLSSQPEEEENEEDSFRVVFENPTDDECSQESDDGIVFMDESKNLNKPAPSRSVSIVSMTNSKFWKEISEEVETEEECMDALVWDHKNHKPASVYLYIVMQLCQKESLRTWLKNYTGPRNRLHCLDIFNQICTGVEYVHSQGVIHRDLKPSNIFFTVDGTVKIGDFGLATAGNTADLSDFETKTDPPENDPGEDGHTEEVGTELYMSPEQLVKHPYNSKVDIYSLGLILFELLVPFGTQMERIHTLTKLRKSEFPADFVSDNSEEYKLVKAMLDHDPGNRPEAIDILDNDFLRQAQIEYENETISLAFGSDGDSLSYQRRRRKHLSSGGSNSQ